MYKNKKLPVWAVVKRSYGYVWRNRGLLALPLGLLLAVQIVIGLIAFGLSAVTAHLFPAPIFFYVCWLLLAYLTLLPFIVGLHRTVLLDEICDGTAFLRWDRYLWNTVKTGIVALLVGTALQAVFTLALVIPLGMSNLMALFLLHPLAMLVLAFVTWLASLYIGLRMILAFPAAALGYRRVFSLSWRITEGNVLRLLTTFALIYLPFIAVNLVIASVGARVAVGQPSSIGAWVFTALFFLVGGGLGAVAISILTVAMSLSFFLLFKASDEFGEE